MRSAFGGISRKGSSAYSSFDRGDWAPTATTRSWSNGPDGSPQTHADSPRDRPRSVAAASRRSRAFGSPICDENLGGCEPLTHAVDASTGRGRSPLNPLGPRSSLVLDPDARPPVLLPLRRTRLTEWLATTGTAGRFCCLPSSRHSSELGHNDGLRCTWKMDSPSVSRSDLSPLPWSLTKLVGQARQPHPRLHTQTVRGHPGNDLSPR